VLPKPQLGQASETGTDCLLASVLVPSEAAPQTDEMKTGKGKARVLNHSIRRDGRFGPRRFGASAVAYRLRITEPVQQDPATALVFRLGGGIAKPFRLPFALRFFPRAVPWAVIAMHLRRARTLEPHVPAPFGLWPTPVQSNLQSSCSSWPRRG